MILLKMMPTSVPVLKAFDLLRKNYPLRREWAAHGGPQA